MINGLVLCMQPAHPHRFVNTRQPYGIAHLHFTTQGGTGHHQTRTFNGKRPVDGQTKAMMAGMFPRRKLLQMMAKCVDPAPFCGDCFKQRSIGKAIFAQRGLHRLAHLVNTRRVHTIGFGQRHG